jgi:hypothetical protein
VRAAFAFAQKGHVVFENTMILLALIAACAVSLEEYVWYNLVAEDVIGRLCKVKAEVKLTIAKATRMLKFNKLNILSVKFLYNIDETVVRDKCTPSVFCFVKVSAASVATLYL